ncbi:MAG: hypothetical protein QOK31_1392 [Solirubrobacteraceae bacterium]|nr:hypothetical protein [Solirubrobacteraceae bacterium]
MKRLLALLAVAVMLSGCGGTPDAQQAARARFLDIEHKLKDDELARLCPSLYPADYLKDRKKYGYPKNKKPRVLTPQDQANARQAHCTPQGTPPKK